MNAKDIKLIEDAYDTIKDIKLIEENSSKARYDTWTADDKIRKLTNSEQPIKLFYQWAVTKQLNYSQFNLVLQWLVRYLTK